MNTKFLIPKFVNHRKLTSVTGLFGLKSGEKVFFVVQRVSSTSLLIDGGQLCGVERYCAVL